jgi:RNA polymerase sigma-70 factor (ECF subfamily)
MQPVATSGQSWREPAIEDTPPPPDQPASEDNRATFERFFAAVSGPLVGQAYVLTGDLQEAQDLAQEALVQAWRHWPRIRDYDDPGAWARRVLHNLAVSRWRRAALRRRHEGTQPIAASPPPESSHVDLVGALGRLPVRQRRAVVLHDVVGLTAEEVGAEMGAAASTVRTWLHRAHKRLEEELNNDERS